jgi:Protein of unknown function (DUF3738)
MKRVVIIAIAWGASVAAAYSQTAPDSTQSFAAASVKALKTVDGPVHFTVLPNRLDVANLSLGYLIKQAYDLRDDQLSGPDWLSKNHYDIAATSGDAASPAVMRVMLQHLLVERFHLATHWETRTVAVYRLVVLSNGPKMKVADHGFAMPNSPMMSATLDSLCWKTGRRRNESGGFLHHRVNLRFRGSCSPSGRRLGAAAPCGGSGATRPQTRSGIGAGQDTRGRSCRSGSYGELNSGASRAGWIAYHERSR